ncbi:MAG: hypothetical protein IJW59_00765 [Clostridia bacterium]|nr:hypothetical protein [Clostridia bacterium]
MEKRNTIICLIFLGIILASAVATIIFSGITAQDYNYVQLEVNPRVEFLLDKKFKVVSVAPLNDDARIVLSDMNLVGMDIEDATTDYLMECARTGFIDVNGVNNATNITVLDGLTQALDVHVTQKVYDFFKDNEIMSAVTESYEDRTLFDKKKKEKVSCSNKLKLIYTLAETQNLEFNTLKKMSEVSLIDIVAETHKENPFTPTETELSKKQSLLKTNQEKFNTHQNAITNNTQREFAYLFDKFQKTSTKKYFEDFSKEYTNWQKQHTN